MNIIEYQAEHKTIFRNIGEEWITKYMTLTDRDREILNDPKSCIIDKGGEIIFAELDGHIVGTAALSKKSDTRFELSKLGVTPAAQGKGIGKTLALEIIKRARHRGLNELYLESNQVLKTAINLYRKIGFREISEENRTPQCDIQMVLTL